MKRFINRRRSPIVALPRQMRAPSEVRLKMSTNCTAWLRSIMDWVVTSNTTT